MSYTLYQTDDVASCKALDTLIFPLDEWEEADAYWLVEDEYEDYVGFCSIRRLRQDKEVAFLTRAGLLGRVQGSGIQKDMLKVREEWARANNIKCIITYTFPNNFPSIINLIKAGYRFYEPLEYWGGDTSLYFMKYL